LCHNFYDCYDDRNMSRLKATGVPSLCITDGLFKHLYIDDCCNFCRI